MDAHTLRELLARVQRGELSPDDAAARGEQAVEGLASTLLAIAARRLAAGDEDDLATLVPEYVTLPRGVRSVPADGGVEVSGGAPSRMRP
jgi:hypothetical protein